MPTDTNKHAITIPVSTDDPDVVADLETAVLDIENHLVGRYSDTTDRSTRNPSPQLGEIAYMMDTDIMYVWGNDSGGTGWKQVWPPDVPAILSGTTVPDSGTGSDGDVFLKV
jgi:hypothetical protein